MFFVETKDFYIIKHGTKQYNIINKKDNGNNRNIKINDLDTSMATKRFFKVIS